MNFTILKKSGYQWLKEEGVFLLLLLLLCLIGYGRFLFHAPIYDFYNIGFPYRYFVVDTIHQRCLPFWNPYQSMGLPAYADPGSNAFYLPLWIFALVFGKYTTICCGAEYLFHVFVGGVGFFYLSRDFVKNPYAAFVTAGFYMLSGFFVGNAQHLSWIVAAAWLPWVLFSFIRLLDSPGIRPALLFPLFFSLMLTGAYPAFVFVTAYFLVAIFVFYLWKRIRCPQHDWRKFLIFGAVSALLCLLLSAPTLISYWEIRPEITRGAGLSFDKTAEPLTLRCMISLLFPYIACSDSSFTHTDISMGSIYMGLFALPAIAVGLWKNRQPLLWVLLGMGLWAFVSAFGTHIPVNRIFFEVLPLLNVIRLPGLYRLFFILVMLLFAAKGFGYLLENSATLALIAARRPRVLMLFAAIMLAEPLVQANICGPKTIYDTRDLHECLSRATSTEGFPIPDSLSSAEKMMHQHELYALWTNVGFFVKEVEWYSNNALRFYRNQKMLQKYHESETSLSLPMAFFPKDVVYDTLPHFLTADTAYTLRPESVFSCDSGRAEIAIRRFKPGYVVVETQTDTARPFALCQNVYKGWQATIDGNPVKLDTLNFAMQSVTVPAGTHQVVLEFRRPFIGVLFLLQAIFSVLMVLMLCFDRAFLPFSARP